MTVKLKIKAKETTVVDESFKEIAVGDNYTTDDDLYICRQREFLTEDNKLVLIIHVDKCYWYDQNNLHWT